MAILRVNNRPFDIDLIVFDKDGTLIEFDYLWASRTKRCVDALAGRIAGDGALQSRLYRSLGVDPQSARVSSDGPLATVPQHKLSLIAATVLYQHGLPWHEAEAEAGQVFTDIMAAAPQAGEIRAIGDVNTLFARLRQAGIAVALATSDDRMPTRAALKLLALQEHVRHIVCGDDDIPCKPAPDGLLHLARLAGSTPERMMMVGDSDCDMQTGRNAGVACCLGVLSGTADRGTLARNAHAVIDSVHGIEC